MKYVICKIVYPVSLERRIVGGGIVNRLSYEILNIEGINNYHDDYSGADKEIRDNLDKLRGFQLVVLPVYNINSEGNLY